jgi:glucosyl-3-phosphoglycerate synthase
MRLFHHSRFADARALLAEKRGAGSPRIAVCIPTLDEAETIGGIVATVRRDLIEAVPLVDDLLVIDSGSTDGTPELARQAGARVLAAAEVLPAAGHHTGKGENLWKSLHASDADLFCFIDGDLTDFHAGFVTGLLGPLLSEPAIDYVKAFYERPLDRGDHWHASGGGRVSEILVRPLISLFYPDLCEIRQPLAGEYAARRRCLESLPFPTGYGVEIAHLIDLCRAGLLDRLAQTDLDRRVHRNRPDHQLGAMAFAILRVVLRRLERDGRLTLDQPLPEIHRSFLRENGRTLATAEHLPEPERPPARDFP